MKTEQSDLRTIRIEKKVGLSELAEESGVGLDTLKKWERGFEVPDAAGARRVARSLGVNAGKLLEAQRRFAASATSGEGYVTARQVRREILDRREEPAQGQHKVLDLFCGSGGFSYGFEEAGFVVTAGVDLLSDRIDTYRANHPTATSIIGDIRETTPRELGDAAVSPEIVIGGPPCQGFSSIRPFRNLALGDQRNNLFEQFALVVSELRPRWFVLENVVGLLTHGSGDVLPQLLSAFAEAGYTVDWRILNAANYGLPQNRERLVVVGNRVRRTFEWPIPTHVTDHKSMAGSRARRIHVEPLFTRNVQPAVTVMEAIHDLPPVEAGEIGTTYLEVALTPYERRMRAGSRALTLHEATRHSERMLRIVRLAGTNRNALPPGMTTSGFSSCYSRLDPDLPAVTMTVNFVHPSSNKCIHPFQHRALTPREGARLQGFPDRFAFAGTRSQIVKQIGNAVPPVLGETIARAIAAQW